MSLPTYRFQSTARQLWMALVERLWPVLAWQRTCDSRVWSASTFCPSAEQYRSQLSQMFYL
jgi:hypothetical protein